jgi:hypothetical protein
MATIRIAVPKAANAIRDLDMTSSLLAAAILRQDRTSRIASKGMTRDGTESSGAIGRKIVAPAAAPVDRP